MARQRCCGVLKLDFGGTYVVILVLISFGKMCVVKGVEMRWDSYRATVQCSTSQVLKSVIIFHSLDKCLLMQTMYSGPGFTTVN